MSAPPPLGTRRVGPRDSSVSSWGLDELDRVHFSRQRTQAELGSRRVRSVRAYRLTAPGRAEVVDVPEPRPAHGDVLLRVRAAGVCRTDLALLRSGAARLPVTLGHEIVGDV